jgi:glycosyltransferase involved in cell wall biosynthesis
VGQDILFLPISGPRGASSRYRVFQFLPWLTEAGITHAVHLPPDSPGSGIQRLVKALRERRAIAGMAHESRSVFVQKRLLPVTQVDALAAARPLAFDFDDAIFTSPSGERSRVAQRRVEERLKHVLATAKIVIAGNRYLCDYANQFARRVVHLPTVIDHTRYPAKAHAETPKIVIGWIGHSVNHPYLLDMSEILQELAKRWKIRLLVVSDRDLAIPGVQVENRRWSEATEVRDILDMDIGIMPMPDDPWSRGKCGFKAIQYMAAGIPVVCAAVGANIEIVRDRIDGFCAGSEAQWRDGLAALIADVNLRQQIGTAARARIQANYSLENAAPQLIDTLSALCEMP